MIGAYWVSLGLGLAALVAWIIMRGLAHADVAVRWDPDARIGRGRIIIAGLVGFGMGGLSLFYSGRSVGMSVAGALGGAVVMAAYAATVDESDPAHGENEAPDVQS